ncbi:hypothetical protein [Massilia sp. Se16.2.3]|uniref:hypothetical protein n=1 Tax=Massilia sp. Se16.2.3 TaxID=2709303 RepID=UPI0016027912|nr:hypothetical protein [Massilia sp. Se16.2.3]QNA98204.1 hypothetical protein G4G31_04100 [Massilia sp. Se16.2.3]
MPPPFICALLLHGLLGLADIVVNHELLAKLPARPGAAEEEGLHAAREAIFACLFASLAWYAWHGDWVWWIGILLLAEVIVSARDVVVEGDTRVLPVSERVLHLLLFINLGVLITLAAYVATGWHAAPAGLARVDYGWASWILSALALGAAAWALRDARSALRLARGMA